MTTVIRWFASWNWLKSSARSEIPKVRAKCCRSWCSRPRVHQDACHGHARRAALIAFQHLRRSAPVERLFLCPHASHCTPAFATADPPYQGWQSQPGGRTVQDVLEKALRQFADQPVRIVVRRRTDTGVHALNQVVHFDIEIERELFSGCVASTAICRRTSPYSGAAWSRPISCPQQRTGAALCLFAAGHPCARPSSQPRRAGSSGRWAKPRCGRPPVC